MYSSINFQPYPTESMEKYVSVITKYNSRNERVTDEQLQSLRDIMPDIFSRERNCQIKKSLIGNVLIALCKRKQQVLNKYI